MEGMRVLFEKGVKEAESTLFHGAHGRGDFQQFIGDLRLARLVVIQGKAVDDVFGVFRGPLHGDHAGGVLGRAGFQHDLDQAVEDVKRQDGIQQCGGARLQQ